jgi:hypothetical protein
MRGEARGVKREPLGAPFHDVCGNAGREPLRPNALSSLIPHAAKQRAFDNASGVQPCPQGRNWTGNITARNRDLATQRLLVRLTPADGDKQALGRLLQVLHIERDEFGASECAREAEQQNGAVARSKDCLGSSNRTLSRDRRMSESDPIRVGDQQCCL